jgi:hypothetical protein
MEKRLPPVLLRVQPGWGRGRAKWRFMSHARLRTTCTWVESWTAAGASAATGPEPARDAVVKGLGPVFGCLTPRLGPEESAGLEGSSPQIDVGAVAFVEAAMQSVIREHKFDGPFRGRGLNGLLPGFLSRPGGRGSSGGLHVERHGQPPG